MYSGTLKSLRMCWRKSWLVWNLGQGWGKFASPLPLSCQKGILNSFSIPEMNLMQTLTCGRKELEVPMLRTSSPEIANVLHSLRVLERRMEGFLQSFSWFPFIRRILFFVSNAEMIYFSGFEKFVELMSQRKAMEVAKGGAGRGGGGGSSRRTNVDEIFNSEEFFWILPCCHFRFWILCCYSGFWILPSPLWVFLLFVFFDKSARFPSTLHLLTIHN